MAKLPSAEQMRRVPAPANTPGVKVASIDYSPIARGGAAIARGAQQFGWGLTAAAAASQQEQDKHDAAELERRLLDFRLASEKALEEAQRTMPEGGAGFADGFQSTWRAKVREFVGKDDQNIPGRLRDRAGTYLKRMELSLVDRANDLEFKARDEKTIRDTSSSIDGWRAAVSSDPDRYKEISREGEQIINNLRLRPQARAKLMDKYRADLASASVEGRVRRALASGASREEIEKIRSDLLPNMKRPEDRDIADDIDWQGSPQAKAIDERGAGPDQSGPMPDYRGRKGPASIRFNNPGAQYPGASSRKFGATHTEIIGGGHKIAVFPNAVSGAAAQFDLLSRRYVGKTLASAIETWSGGNSSAAYAARVASETGLSTSTKLTKDMMANPAIAIPLAKAMAEVEAGRAYPMSDGDWQRAHQMALGGVPVPSGGGPVQVADASGNVPASFEDNYTGPYQGLTYKQRAEMYDEVGRAWNKVIAGVDKEMKTYLDGAKAGYPMLPDDLVDKVRRLDDPYLNAKIAELEVWRGITRETQREPLPVSQQRLMAMQERLNSGQATPGEKKLYDHLKGVVDGKRAELNDDPLTYSWRAGVQLGQTGAVKPLNFADDAAMQERMGQVRSVPDVFGVPGKFFRGAKHNAVSERKIVDDILKGGGQTALAMFASMTRNWGGANTERALAEIETKAPEMVIAGMLYATNPQAAEDIAMAVEARQSPNYKATSNLSELKDKQIAVTGVFGEALDSAPPNIRSGIIRAADAIYEVRNKDKSKPDTAEYTKILKEIAGERTKGGQTYGGIVTDGAGWSDGLTAYKIPIPPNYTNNSSNFRRLITSITKDDLEMAGLPLPVKANGDPLQLSTVLAGKLVPVGNEVGRYRVMLDHRGTGQFVMAESNPPMFSEDDGARIPEPEGKVAFEIDLNALEPILKARSPHLFYDGEGAALSSWLPPSMKPGFESKQPQNFDDPNAPHMLLRRGVQSLMNTKPAEGDDGINPDDLKLRNRR